MKINKQARRKSSKHHGRSVSIILIFMALVALCSFCLPALF
jgi:hypothetical protein